MELTPKKFRAVLLLLFVVICFLSAIFHFITSSISVTTWSRDPLLQATAYNSFSYKPLMMAAADRIRAKIDRVETILTGTSTTAYLFAQYQMDYADQMVFLDQGTKFPYSLYLNFDDYLKLQPKKIKYLTASGGWIVPPMGSDKVMPRPFSFENYSFYIKSAQEFKQNAKDQYVKDSVNVSLARLTYAFLTRENLASYMPSILLQSQMNIFLDQKNKVPTPVNPYYATQFEAIDFNFFLIAKLLPRFESQGITFYFIEDRIKETCLNLENPLTRQHMIEKANELQSQFKNFKFIKREEIPVISDDHYIDCVHVESDKADWKNEKIKYLIEI